MESIQSLKLKTNRGDWYEIIQTERESLNITLTDEEIEQMSREKYKSIVEKHIQREGLKYLCGLAAPHSKSDFIVSDKLEKQAGAELCQAQEKLGLTKPDLPVVIFYLL